LDALIAFIGGLASLGAGVGGGLAYARRSNGRHKTEPPPPMLRRPEQMPPELSDTQRDLRASTMLGGMRCDRHQALEDTVAELASAARERGATATLRFDQVDARLDSHHAVLSELRDAVLRIEARDDREPRRYPVGVVRGGAAVPR
jgi:hypothetical protein